MVASALASAAIVVTGISGSYLADLPTGPTVVLTGIVGYLLSRCLRRRDIFPLAQPHDETPQPPV